MREKQTHARFGFLMSALALMSTPSAVLAQETCATDTDCEHGYTCEEIGGDCATVDCAGDDCEAPPPCETELGCVPVTDCSADSDCIDGWKCITSTATDDCTRPEPAPACDPADPDCVKADDEGFAPADCGEPREVSACIAPWLLPCVAADDCGAGFECVERISEWCNGSSGGSDPGEPTPGAAGAGGDGFAPPPDDAEPPPPECGSEPTGEYYCHLIETTCSVDSDCAAGLTCQTFVEEASCAGGGSSGGDTPAAPDGGVPQDRIAPPECQQPEPTYACAPPSFQVSLDYGYGESRDDAATGGADPQPQTDDDENSGPTTGEESPAAPVDGDTHGGTEMDDSAGDTMKESSGCSAPGSLGAHGDSGVLLMVLAVLGLARRRRSLHS